MARPSKPNWGSPTSAAGRLEVQRHLPSGKSWAERRRLNALHCKRRIGDRVIVGDDRERCEFVVCRSLPQREVQNAPTADKQRVTDQAPVTPSPVALRTPQANGPLGSSRV